jgi:hypothetical protein
MQTDVKAAHLDGNATVFSGPTRVKGYQVAPGGTAGEIVFRDGGASGTVRLRVNISATPTNPFSTLIPGNGIRFTTDVHVTLPTAAAVTIFCG